MRHPGVITLVAALSAVLTLGAAGSPGSQATSAPAKKTANPAPKKPAAAAKAFTPETVDGLLAPVALYPDQLLAQMLLSAPTPARVAELDKWLKTKPPYSGTALQDAARQMGFGPSFVALVLFPQVVDFMATNLDWTTEVGQAFTSDRNAVLASVQRLRADSIAAGKLKTTPQQSVSVISTDGGEKVIVIEPTNPQVVYVPQYNTQTVYTNPPPTSTTVVIKEESSNNDAAMAAGLIGFTAGIAIGAAIDNDYYYGPYGWHGGPYMYGGDWDDWYDEREDAREDWYEHREDMREDIQDNREDLAESRGDRSSSAQQQRTERQQTRQEGATARQSQSSSGTQATAASGQTRERTGASSYEAQGKNRERASTASERSGTGSDAFSNYSRGKSERSASARGQRSRSGGSGGGGRRR
jgi:hypothetical protein